MQDPPPGPETPRDHFIEKREAKIPVFLEEPSRFRPLSDNPLGNEQLQDGHLFAEDLRPDWSSDRHVLAQVLYDDAYSQDRHVVRRNKELKFLMDVFATIDDLESDLKGHRLWDYIWEVRLKPIKEAAEKST